jgi:hypothetical protein
MNEDLRFVLLMLVGFGLNVVVHEETHNYQWSAILDEPMRWDFILNLPPGRCPEAAWDIALACVHRVVPQGTPQPDELPAYLLGLGTFTLVVGAGIVRTWLRKRPTPSLVTPAVGPVVHATPATDDVGAGPEEPGLGKRDHPSEVSTPLTFK